MLDTLGLTELPSGDADGDNLDAALALASELKRVQIPPRPLALQQMHAELGKDEPDFGKLADIIGSDVSLSASIIKVTNSPFFGLGKRVRSVPEAMLVLGLRVIIQTVAGVALQRAFPNIVSLERFWDSAARTARVSGWLASQLKGQCRVRPDEAYTLGLFRDCGIPALMGPFPDYVSVLKAANQEPALAFTVVEDQRLSTNHAVVGGELAEDWLLPEELIQGIRYHHHVAAVEGKAPDIKEATGQLIAIVQVAEFLIQSKTGLSQTQEWLKLGPASMDVLSLGASDLKDLAESSRPIVTGGD